MAGEQPYLAGFEPAPDSEPQPPNPGPNAMGAGLMVLHSHRAERLLDVVLGWLQQHPLGPLEEEVFIVQSNAVAEWLNMALAQQLGVCAATRVELPGRFFWRIGRMALGAPVVPAVLPMDKLPLTWRLMAHLPQWLDDPAEVAAWQPLKAFLAPDATQRLWPLCERLADLYDQYQIYRPDWLDAWAKGLTHITNGAGQPVPLGADQVWQARLWQQLVGTLVQSEQAVTRPALMQRVLGRLNGPVPAAQPLPRRVVAFGMSHLPPGLLELLGAVSRHSQVLLAVPNPCQYHWADVIDGRQLLRGLHRRLPAKREGLDLAALPLEAMHAHAHPLLAAWGRQSRDFVRLLDAVDDTARGLGQPGWPRLDLFVQDGDREDHFPSTLLRQVQNAIRDLLPLAEQIQQPSHAWKEQDRSIVFHSAHSPVRELEVLHDQLLALLGHNGLQPKDVVVMVPDMAPVAPAIRAVFGQYAKGDARFIPFDLADLGAEALSPLIQAWHWLWRLPQERVGLSEWLSLLEVPAVQARFGFEADDLPQLAQWLAGAGMRWGLHADHRAAQGLPDLGSTHTAQFAVDRMLWGYAIGPHPSGHAEGGTAPEPFADVAGLDAALAGSMAHLLNALAHWWGECQQPATPAQWVARGRRLLHMLFQADLPLGDSQPEAADPAASGVASLPPPVWPRSRLSPADQAAIEALLQAGHRWLEASADAGFTQPMALEVARSAWEHALRLPESDARFHAGGVTFCTLLPMRAIPFRVVCLLGMNDGDYPRRAPRPDLDLMTQPGMARPGDRSRRDDDRQLMLEALLSARDVLYISWCGHSVRDNAEQPPSVLVAQLRDHIAQGWGQAALTALTTQHPLQPFSPRYLQGDPKLFTHAHEWQAIHQKIQEQKNDGLKAVGAKNALKNGLAETSPDQTVTAPAPSPDWTLRDLAEALRHPVRLYSQRRLSVVWQPEEDATPDDEPFALDGLQRHQLQRELLDAVLDTMPCQLTAADMAKHLHTRLQQAQRAGELPLGAPGAVWQSTWVPELVRHWQAWQTVRAALPTPADRLRLDGPAPLSDWVDALFLPDVTNPAWAQLQAQFAGLAEASQVCRLRDHARVLEKASDGRPSKKVRSEKLLVLWLRSLALSSSAPHPQQAHVLWVGADAVVHAQPLPREEAVSTLAKLVAHLQAVLQEPTPLPPRTALAWLQDAKAPALPWAKLRTVYEGGYETQGEAPSDPYWSRFFPDLDSLLQSGQFQTLAPAIWGELLRWQAGHVAVVPHPVQEADA